VDRRRFLAVIGVLGVTAITADACGGSGDPSLVLIPNDWDYFAGSTYRMAILLASSKVNGAPIALTSPVSLRVGPENGPLGPLIPMTIHANGPEPSYALTTYRFDKPGVYQLQASYKGRTTSLPITVTDPSTSTVPVVGNRMVSVATPTVAHPLGVKPVCTQTPPCPFHQVSLDQALAEHRRIALLFATPALCTSRFCGPVLLNVQAVHDPWTSSVTFIHCEIYTDLTGQTTTHPVQAWQLEHEPMLYLAGADGIIKARVDNLFDRDEARAVLKATFG
jgi:hypothetical protein